MFVGDIAADMTSYSASNTPVQRRKQPQMESVSFTIGESPLSVLTKENIPNDHMTSGDQGDITKGSRGELSMTRKGSLNRGESDDTINGGDN